METREDLTLPTRLQIFFESGEYLKYQGATVAKVPCHEDNYVRVNFLNIVEDMKENPAQDMEFAFDWLSESYDDITENCDEYEYDSIYPLASCPHNINDDGDYYEDEDEDVEEEEEDWETDEEIFFFVDLSKPECPVGFACEQLHTVTDSFDEFLKMLTPNSGSLLKEFIESTNEED